ncbi:TAP-like protein-domain-containing protein [Gautieria morchelliformis]|nr:TAP-like protein-domain-containing protein [Gautieria morchelliformis]
MEKVPLYQSEHNDGEQPPSTSRKSLWYYGSLKAINSLILLALCVLYLRRYAPFSAPNPKPGINWSPCGDNIDCGRLSVPLDYHNANLGTANLAVARYRATNTTARLGTLFTNPGGPGGSGVSYVYRAGPRISGVVDGRYDIVSWDPRGINGTTPRVDCFYSQTAQDLYHAHTHYEMGLEGRNLTDPIDLAVFAANVHKADATNAALAKLCSDTSGEALTHVGTVTVVRDLEYLSRIIEGDDSPVNFWGFSYGTAIGSYFVNMFPNRVGRVIIDGVVDPVIWANSYSNEWFKYDLVDTDRAFEHFLHACQTAGPQRCALASDKSTSKSIGTRVDKFLSDIYDYPLPVDKAKRPGALTSGMVRGYIFTSMYGPRTWPDLAANLAAAIDGNGTAIMDLAQEDVELDTSVKARTAQAISAVTCVDTPAYPANVDTAAVVKKNIDEAVLTYELTSKRFASLELDMCHHWTPRETERFTGPFNSSLSNQVLIIGNTADPITPVANAKAVNQLLQNDSRLLIQDGSGHCSTAMASLCTGKIIQNYLFEGRLPPNGMVCPTNETLFPPTENVTNLNPWTTAGVLDIDDQRLLENLKGLGEEMGPFLMRRRR